MTAAERTTIAMYVDAIATAIDADDPAAAQRAAMVLLRSMLIDLNRIADATEKMAEALSHIEFP